MKNPATPTHSLPAKRWLISVLPFVLATIVALNHFVLLGSGVPVA